VPTLHALAEILVRAASLLALAAVPPLSSPEPLPSANPLVEAAIALALLTAVVLAAARFRAKLASPDALAGGALLVLAVIVAIVCATFFRGADGPLARGVLWVALPFWAGLAVIAGAVAERRLGESFRHKRLAAAVVVICTGVSLVASQSGWIFSRRQMWWQALKRDGSNGAAADGILADPLRTRDYKAALEVLDRCLVASPGSCACLSRRAHIWIRKSAPQQALQDAHEAVAACPDDPGSRAALITARAYKGDALEAEMEARAALGRRDHALYHYALAIALDAQGKRTEAIDEARRAVDGGAGRDAAVTLGVLAIVVGDLDTAQKALAPVVAANPQDAEAQYDLALVAQKSNRYNEARQGYLAALTADPTMADARYNLVDLTLRQHVIEEARYHARRFAEAFPDDPRNAVLAQMVAAAAAAPPR
jgi:tetratricopeptide (TPR) repeat protein